jgi:hypothetical protein
LDAIGNGLQALKLSALANPPKPPMPASMTEEGGEGAAAAPEADAQADKTPDPYAKFPLPYVIGTVEFHEDDFCGLFLSSEGAHTSLHHRPGASHSWPTFLPSTNADFATSRFDGPMVVCR